MSAPIRTIGWLLEVDVGIAQGPAGAVVPAHTDRGNGACRGELVEQIRLGHIVGQVAHVQGRRVEVHVAGIHLAGLLLWHSHNFIRFSKFCDFFYVFYNKPNSRFMFVIVLFCFLYFFMVFELRRGSKRVSTTTKEEEE